MGKKKHQFINKKTSRQFNLVHRSQRDPLQADEDSSQHVLIPVDRVCEGTPGPSGVSKEEQVKYGIYYDDDYDYLQHLKPRGTGMLIVAEEPVLKPVGGTESFGNIILPSEVLPSKYEEDVGMLNKGVLPRGPQPDWDPDIVAALDDGIDFDDPDNVLEDDFINLANADVEIGESSSNFNKVREFEDENDWETDSDVSSGGHFSSDNLSDEELGGSEDETKSRFTNYSMTSSVIRRTQGLKLLDDRFEHIMEEYDEEEIGAIDHEEPVGTFDINNELISQVIDEFEGDQKSHPLSDTVKEVHSENSLIDDKNSEESDEDEELFKQFEKKPSEKWDCESIISTYSNIYNHPKLIEEPKVIKLHKRTGIPVGVLKENKSDCKKGVDETEEFIVVNNARSKNETPEERRVRKQEFKNLKKDRRKQKKDNKIAFKNEHKKQEIAAIHKASQMGIKM